MIRFLIAATAALSLVACAPVAPSIPDPCAGAADLAACHNALDDDNPWFGQPADATAAVVAAGAVGYALGSSSSSRTSYSSKPTYRSSSTYRSSPAYSRPSYSSSSSFRSSSSSSLRSSPSFRSR